MHILLRTRNLSCGEGEGLKNTLCGIGLLDYSVSVFGES